MNLQKVKFLKEIESQILAEAFRLEKPIQTASILTKDQNFELVFTSLDETVGQAYQNVTLYDDTPQDILNIQMGGIIDFLNGKEVSLSDIDSLGSNQGSKQH